MNALQYCKHILLLKNHKKILLIVKSCSKNDVYECGTDIIV